MKEEKKKGKEGRRRKRNERKVRTDRTKGKWIFQILPLDINHQVSRERESASLWTEAKTQCE